MKEIAKEIERLLQFALQNRIIEELDLVQMRNLLLDLLQIKEPYGGQIEEEALKNPVPILENILDYAAETEILINNTITERDLLDAKIMGILMARQSEVVRNFYNIYKEKGPVKATDDFYALSQAVNYIRMDRIEKNLYWKTTTKYGDLEITINLSKPEKDPKEIAASKLVPQTNYPKCLLCVENVGYAGNANHPARQNHRVIPVTIAEEQWYFQYSPYVYYNEHCIVFKGNHEPMKISEKTFIRLFDFIGQFPHYFIGTNADLPIVGGSILSHEHFQGGRHVFPMELAPIEVEFVHGSYKGVTAGILKWPMSVIRLASSDKNKLIEVSVKILDDWRNYSDEKLEILSHTINEKESIPHNTITPIARRNSKGDFEIDLVLRNNRINEAHPDGIFHPHEELHHIKKENIGLIEVMGLAVLPARLEKELKKIEDILQGKKEELEKAKNDSNNILFKHMEWIEMLVGKYGTHCSAEESQQNLKKEVGLVFQQVLEHAGVFKKDEMGCAGFERFMGSLGFAKKF